MGRREGRRMEEGREQWSLLVRSHAEETDLLLTSFLHSPSLPLRPYCFSKFHVHSFSPKALPFLSAPTLLLCLFSSCFMLFPLSFTCYFYVALFCAGYSIHVTSLSPHPTSDCTLPHSSSSIVHDYLSCSLPPPSLLPLLPPLRPFLYWLPCRWPNCSFFLFFWVLLPSFRSSFSFPSTASLPPPFFPSSIPPSRLRFFPLPTSLSLFLPFFCLLFFSSFFFLFSS